MHRSDAHVIEALELEVDKAPLGTEHHQVRALHGMRAGLASVGMGVAKLEPALQGQGRQHILDERSEAPVKGELGLDRVARLLETESDVPSQGRGLERRGGPVALLHPAAVEEVEVLDPHGGPLLEDLLQRRGTGQRDRELDRRGWWRLPVQGEAQLEAIRIDAEDLTLADLSPEEADAERVARRDPDDLAQVLEPTAPDPRVALVEQIRGLEQQQVHARRCTPRAPRAATLPLPAPLPPTANSRVPAILRAPGARPWAFMSRRASWIIAAIAGATLLGVAGWWTTTWTTEGVATAGGPDGPSAPIPVEVAPIDHGDVDVFRRFSAELEPAASFVVSAKISGRVEAVHVELSDPVTRDALVVELDDAELEQDVKQARAELAVARAELSAARAKKRVADKTHSRVRRLHQKGVASVEELDAAEAGQLEAGADVAVAVAEVKRRSAALEAAQVRADYARVTASWPAPTEDPGAPDATRLVGARHVDEGAMVSANDPLLTIVALDPLVAVAFATPEEYAALAVGQAVTITTDARPDARFEGRVARIAPVFESSSRQARVELEIPNSDRELLPGMFVRASARVDRLEDAITVPRDALVERDGTPTVFVLDDSGTSVHQRSVRVGTTLDQRVTVSGEGLRGDVVVLGQAMLSDGSEVAVVRSHASPTRVAGGASG